MAQRVGTAQIQAFWTSRPTSCQVVTGNEPEQTNHCCQNACLRQAVRNRRQRTDNRPTFWIRKPRLREANTSQVQGREGARPAGKHSPEFETPLQTYVTGKQIMVILMMMMKMISRDELTVCCQEEIADTADQHCVSSESINSGDVCLWQDFPHIG